MVSGTTLRARTAARALHHPALATPAFATRSDGWLRLWDAARLSSLEPPEGSNTIEVEPAVEVLVAPGARIKALLQLPGQRSWVLQDEGGALYQVRADTQTCNGMGSSTASKLGAGAACQEPLG